MTKRGAFAWWRIGLSVLWLATGCATRVHLYEGPPRSPSELAQLDLTGNATMLAIGGRGVDRFDEHFALLPGVHEIDFRVRHGADVDQVPVGPNPMASTPRRCETPTPMP